MATPISKCPECGGTGVVALFSSVIQCRTCAAVGKAEADTVRGEPGVAPAVPALPSRRATVYDEQKRVIGETCLDTAGNVTRHFGLDVPELGTAKEKPADAPSSADAGTEPPKGERADTVAPTRGAAPLFPVPRAGGKVKSNTLSMSFDAQGRIIAVVTHGEAGAFTYSFDKPGAQGG